MDRAAMESVAAHAREALPGECCGLLIGRDADILEARRARNLSDDPDAFELHPEDHIDGRRDARKRGLVVLGFYHSHPKGGSGPSRTDVARAAYPGSLYLIVQPREAGATYRLFRQESAAFVEVEFSVADDLTDR